MKFIQIENGPSNTMPRRRDHLKRSGTISTIDTFALDTSSSTHERGSFRRLSSVRSLDEEIQEQNHTFRDGNFTLKKTRAMSCTVLDNLESPVSEGIQSSASQVSCKSILRRGESCPDFSRKRSVSFDAVEFRLHQRTAGDNPSVSDRGPAFDLEWDYTDGPCESVDDYESRRTTENPRRSSKSSLRIKGREREKMLKYENDVSTLAIQTSIMSINKAKADRMKTRKKMKYEKIDEICESLKRKLRRMFRRKPR